MYKLTKEDKALLKTVEPQMRTALHSNYARSIGDRNMTRLIELWEKIKGTRYPNRGSCASCQLKLLAKVGKWYEEEYSQPEPEVTVNKLDNKAADKQQEKIKDNE